MKNKTRLRIHIAYDLLGARLTPSPRRRDPYAAQVPTQHVLTEQQIELWRRLVPNCRSRVVEIKDKSLNQLVGEIVARLPEKGTAKLLTSTQGVLLEVTVPR